MTLDPTDRDAWVAGRQNRVGASEAGSVLGLSRWDTPVDVWLSKTGRSAPKPQTLAMRRGLALESFICSLWAEAKPGRAVSASDGTILHPTCANVAATPDAFGVDFDDGLGLLECKDVGHFPGKDWASGPPLEVLTQAHVQLAVTGRPWCDIVACIAGRQEPSITRVHNDGTGEEICQALQAWWDKWVATDTCPPIDAGWHVSPARLATALKAAHPVSLDVAITATPEDRAALTTLQRERALAKDLAEDITRGENALKERLGAAGSLVDPDTGRELASWKSQDRSTTDWLKVADQLGVSMDSINTALAASAQPSSIRVLRIPKDKS